MDPVPQCSCSFPPTLPTTPVRQHCPGVGMYGLHSIHASSNKLLQFRKWEPIQICSAAMNVNSRQFLLQKGRRPTHCGFAGRVNHSLLQESKVNHCDHSSSSRAALWWSRRASHSRVEGLHSALITCLSVCLSERVHVCVCVRVLLQVRHSLHDVFKLQREGTLIWSKNIFASLHFSLQLRHLNRVFTTMPVHSHLQILLGLSVKAATFKSPPRRQNALECNVFTWNWFLRCSCQRKQRYPRRTGRGGKANGFFCVFSQLLLTECH